MADEKPPNWPKVELGPEKKLRPGQMKREPRDGDRGRRGGGGQWYSVRRPRKYKQSTRRATRS